MDKNKLRLERQNRILNAMQGKRSDRTPLLFAGDFALIRYARPETTFGYMIREHEEMTETIIREVLPCFPKLDYLAAVGMSSRHLGAAHLAKTYLPGRELPENEMWQLVFEHIVKPEDYNFIIEKGWKKFQELCLSQRLGYDFDAMQQDFEAGMRNKRRYRDAGMPFMQGDMLPAPFDMLAFGRGMMDFFIDLLESPEQVHEVLDIIIDEYEGENAQKIEDAVAEGRTRDEKLMYTVAPCVQANCDLLGRTLFEEFGWPLIKRQADFVIKHGGYVFFHMDANWTGFLDYFTEFPAGRCLFDSDGGTDLYKIRDTLGGKMAFTGSIAPSTLAFGKPGIIYDECLKQIEEMGDSFILAPSCTLPANMPKENIDAMYAAIDR